MHWLNNISDVEATKQALISFKIGPYEDQVVCDACPMDACHILLGRPWQYDRFAKYNGRTNRYVIKKHVDDKPITLAPLKIEDSKKKASVENKKRGTIDKC